MSMLCFLNVETAVAYTMFVYPAVLEPTQYLSHQILIKCTTDVFLIHLLTFSYSLLHFHTNEEKFLFKKFQLISFIFLAQSKKQSKNMSKTMKYLNDME